MKYLKLKAEPYPLAVLKGVRKLLIPSNNLVILTGDSRSANGWTDSATSRLMNIAGIQAHLAYMTGNKIRFIPNDGAGSNGSAIGGSTIGDNTAQGTYARRAAAFASGAKTILLLSGTNGWTYTVDQQMAYFNAYIAEARDAGINVILCNEVPNGQLDGSAGALYHIDLHNRLTALEGAYSNLVVVRTFEAMLRPGYTDAMRPKTRWMQAARRPSDCIRKSPAQYGSHALSLTAILRRFCRFSESGNPCRRWLERQECQPTAHRNHGHTLSGWSDFVGPDANQLACARLQCDRSDGSDVPYQHRWVHPEDTGCAFRDADFCKPFIQYHAGSRHRCSGLPCDSSPGKRYR